MKRPTRKSVPTTGMTAVWLAAGKDMYFRPRTYGMSLASKIEANSMPITECGCWIWLRSLGPRGYGQMSRGSRPRAVHRLSYEAFRGEIPHGMHVLHTCDIRTCVNPDHLYLGTDVENSRDRRERGRQINPPRMCGENHPHAKITKVQALEILASSETHTVLSRRYGVPMRTCQKIKNGTSGYLK